MQNGLGDKTTGAGLSQQWWGHNSGSTMCWGHNVGAQGGHNVGAQSICGGIINLWGHNQFVRVQSICGGTACRAPINCCHLLPFHAILCHPMPSHALPYHAAATMLPCCHTPTMLPCHDLTPMPCPYHAMTPPHALPLPSHATAAICCYLLPPMPSHALSPNSGNPHNGGSTVVEAQSRA
jgi:hypothetical protein